MRCRATSLFALLTAAIPHSPAQSVISARSGLINFYEGDVVLDGHRIDRSLGTYSRLKEGSDLVTRSGRAEVLLAPNTYLRIGADSAIRMISDNLTDTRVELLGGSAVLDSAKAPDGAPVTILFRNSTLRMLKPGQYRIDADPPQLRVFQGEAEVVANGSTSRLGPSQLCPLDGASVVRRFTEGSDNLLDLWSDERRLLISSKMADAQAITDPLLDPDPNANSGLDAYLGYLPLGAVPYPTGSLPAYGIYGGGAASYGVYGGLYPAYSFYGYPALSRITPSYRFGTVYPNRPLVIPGVIPGPRPGLMTVRPPAGAVAPVFHPGVPLTTRPGARIGGRR